MSTQRHDARTRTADVAHQQLQDRSGTDELCAQGVLGKAQCICEARGAIRLGVIRDGVSQIEEVLLRDTAGLLHHLRGVTGVVTLENLEHRVRVLQSLVFLHVPRRTLRLTDILPRVGDVLAGLWVIARKQAIQVLRVLVIGGNDGGGVGVREHVIVEVELVVDHVLDDRAEQDHVSTAANADVAVRESRSTGVARIHVDDARAALLGLNYPLEAHWVALGHVRTLNDDAVRIRHILQRLGCAAAAKRSSQTGNGGRVSNTSLIFDLYRARGGKQLLNQVVLFVVQGRTTQASDAHGAVEGAALFVGVLPVRLAGCHKAIGNHVHGGLGIEVLPLGGVRRTVLDLGQARRRVDQLLGSRALGAQTATRDWGIWVAFDLNDFIVLDINALGTTHRAIRTHRLHDAIRLNGPAVELFALLRLGAQVPAEGVLGTHLAHYWPVERTKFRHTVKASAT